MAYYTDKDGKITKLDEELTPESVGVMERADDDAIIQRMTTGDASEVYVYKYEISTKTGPKTIMGISTDGAHALANEMRNIEVLPGFQFDKESDPDNIYAVIRVKNLSTNVTLLGTGKQCKFVVGAKNEPMRDRPDEHAFVKAVSKAERNGILAHTDAKIVQAIIQQSIGNGKSKMIKPPAVQAGVKPSVAPATPATPKPAQPSTAPKPAVSPLTTAAEALKQQEEKLKKLREQVAGKFRTELGYTDDQRHEAIKQTLGVLEGS